MSLRIDYADTPVGAQESAVISATAGQPFSCAEELKNAAVDIPWATLEPGGWPLDGSRRLIPDGSGKMGWWSYELSELDGGFAQPPTIVLTFPKPYSATGLTLSFCPALGQWCSQIQVFWYRGNTLLDQVLAYPDAAEWILTHPVENFDRVELQLLKTNIPRRFAKLRQLRIGRVFQFTGDELVQVRLLNEMDPSLCGLYVDTMTVDIRQRKGHILYPRKDQTIRLYRDGTRIATHYIADAIRQSRHNYRVRCQSAIGRLEDSFLGGIYQGHPLPILLQEVLGEFPFSVDAAFAGKTLTGYLPVCTRRQALQQIAFAVGAVVSTRGDGTIQLLPLEENVSSSFGADSIFNGAGLKQVSAVGAVELIAHSYVPIEDEKVLLKEKELFGEELFLVFSEPYHSYMLDGGAIIACDANWIRLTANGMVTLTAKQYRHETMVLSKKNPQATASERGNVVTVEMATLIHWGNANDALERLYKHHTLQALLSQDVVVTGQYAGQQVESLTPWNDRIQGSIISMDSTFTDSGHRASIQIRGREVAE